MQQYLLDLEAFKNNFCKDKNGETRVTTIYELFASIQYLLADMGAFAWNKLEMKSRQHSDHFRKPKSFLDLHPALGLLTDIISSSNWLEKTNAYDFGIRVIWSNASCSLDDVTVRGSDSEQTNAGILMLLGDSLIRLTKLCVEMKIYDKTPKDKIQILNSDSDVVEEADADSSYLDFHHALRYLNVLLWWAYECRLDIAHACLLNSLGSYPLQSFLTDVAPYDWVELTAFSDIYEVGKNFVLVRT